MQKRGTKVFINNILNGAATGIVVGLIPNAIFSEIFKALASYHEVFATLAQVVGSFQFTVPFLVGIFAALQFGFQGIKMAALAGGAFIGSGAATLIDGVWQLQGTGDLINTMVTIAIGTVLLNWYGDRLPNLAIVLLPLIGGIIPGFLGLYTLPYVGRFTLFIGNVVAQFTDLQPLIMMVLVSVLFALIIVTPISSVAIAYAISLSGLAAGAGNVGIAATVFTLAYGSSRVNHPGTTIALFFAGPKLMMANYLKNLIMTVPLVINAAVTGMVAYFFQIQGTTASAGFGITGLAGPINAYALMSETSPMMRIVILVIQYLIVPLGVAAITHTLFTKMNLYSKDIYENNPNKA